MELNINNINNIAERIRENSYHGDSNVTEWIEELARRDEQAKKAARRLLHAQAKAELRRSERAWARREARITRKIVVKGLCFITAINTVAEALGIANREYALAEGNVDMAKAAKAVLAVIDDEEAAKARAEKLAANAVRNALRRQQKAAKAARKADKVLNAEIAAAVKGERKDARKLLPKKAARSQVALPADVGVLDTAVTTAELKAFVDGGCICSTAVCDDADVQSVIYGAMRAYNSGKATPAEMVMNAIHEAVAVRLVSNEILAEVKDVDANVELIEAGVQDGAETFFAKKEAHEAMNPTYTAHDLADIRFMQGGMDFDAEEAAEEALGRCCAKTGKPNMDMDASRHIFNVNFVNTKKAQIHDKAVQRKLNKEAVKEWGVKDLPESLQCPLSTKAAHEFVKHVLKNAICTASVRYQMIKLSAGNEYRHEEVHADMSLTTFGINKLTARYLREARTRSVWAYNDGMVRLIGNALEKQPVTDEMLMIDAAELDNNIDMDIARSVRENGVSVKFVPAEKKAYFCFRTHVKRSDGTDSDIVERTILEMGANGSKMYSFDGVNDVDECKAFMAELAHKEGEVRTYRFFYAGPSNQRQQNFILFLQHKGESKAEFDARIRDDFNYLTGGLLTALEEKVAASKDGVKREKLFKLVSRISLAFTPQTPMFSMKAFAFFNGALGSGKGDGQWLFDGALLAEQQGLPLNGVLGLGYQARMTNGVINKGMGIAVSHLDIATIIASYETVQVSHRQFRKMWIEGTLKKDTMYLVGGKCPGAIFDDNSMKAVVDTPEDGKFSINLMSVKSNTPGKLNIQNAESIAAIEGAPEFIFEEGKKYIDKKLDEIKRVLVGNLKDEIVYTDEEREQAVADDVVLPLTLSVVNPDMYWPQLVSEVAPMQVAHDKKLYQMFVEDVAKGLTKDISKFNFKISDMEYRTLQSDYAGMILGDGLGVLAEKEIFMPGIKEGILTTLTRCPKADKYEFYQATTVGLDTILERLDKIAEMGLASEALVSVVKRMFQNADTALVITPDDPKVVNSLGGSDFDADGALCDMNEMSNAIFSIIGDGSSTIPDGKVSGIKIKHFDINMVQDMFFAGIYGQEDAQGRRVRPVGIGIIANHATLISALRTCNDDKLQEVLNDVIIPAVKALGIKSDGHIYQRGKKFMMEIKLDDGSTKLVENPDVTVTDEDIIELNRNFYTSDLSLESFKNALADADRCGSSVEGRGIDVNKTGDTVHAGYLAALEKKDDNFDPIIMRGGKRCKAYDTIKFEAAFKDVTDEESKRTFRKMSYTKPGYGNEKVIYIESKISGVRDQLMDYLVDRINEFFLEDIQEGAVESRLVNDTKLTALANKKVCMGDLKNAKSIYDATMHKDLSSVEKRIIRKYLANTVRWYFAPGTRAFEKFLQIKAAAKVSGKDSSVGYTSFEYVLPEEYMQGVLYIAKTEGWKTNQVLGYKAYVLDESMIADGEKVCFTKGATTDGSHIVTDKNASGEWTMRKLGNSWYATHTAAEHFAEPAVDGKLVVNTVNKYKGENITVDVTDAASGDGTMTFGLNGYQAVGHFGGSDKKWNFFAAKDGKVQAFARDNGCIKIAQVMQSPERGSEVTIVCGYRAADNGNNAPVANKVSAQKIADLKKKAISKKVVIKVNK